MGKKRLKDIFKRTLASVLSATMVLGMTASSTLAGNSTGTLPTVDDSKVYSDADETLTDATELTRASLGKSEINIITKDVTNKLGNAADYNQDVTYIAGYVQIADTTDIDYIMGLRMNVNFSREMKNVNDTGIDFDSDEYFEYYSGNAKTAVDVFGNNKAEAQCVLTMDSYATKDHKSYDYITTDNLYNMTDEDLDTAYSVTKKPMAFIIALYNLKDDVNISYSVQPKSNAYLPKNAGSTTDSLLFGDTAIKIAPSLVRLKRYSVVFDTDTNKNKLTVGKDFTVTKPADQMIKDDRDEEGNNTDVIDQTGGIDPAIKEATAGYEVEGWYTDEACENKFTMTTPITESLYNWNSKTNTSDANNDTLKLYAKYTAKDTATLTVHCYLDGTETEVRPDADQAALNKTGRTFGTTESVTAPTVTGYTLKEGTTTPASVVIDSMTKEHTFYYTASSSTGYKVRIHKTKLDSAAQTETYDGGETVDIALSDGTSGQSKTINPATLATTNDTYKNAVAGLIYDAAKTGTENLTKTIAADGSTIFDVYYSRDKYTVTFDTQTRATEIGGTATTVPAKELFYGSLVPNPGTVTLTGADGYEHSGWATKDGENYSAWDLSSDVVEGPVTLYAQYVAKGNVSYTVRYMLKDTTTKIKDDVTGTGKFNEKITPAITAPDITGYTFDGDKAALADIVLDEVGKIITLYYTGNEATYTIETYKQNTAGNGYDKDDALTKIVNANIGDVIAAITPDTLTGFTFESGNTNNVLSGTVPATGALVLKVYYTRNKITITFNPDGNKPLETSEIDKTGLVPGKLTQSIPYETSPEDPGKPATEGYDFGGWSTDGTPENKVTPGTDELTEGQTLVPIWTAKDDVSYTVKYYLEGTTTAVPGTTEKSVTGQTFNTEVTEEAPGVDGYTAKAPTTQKITLNAYNKEIVFYYTADDAKYYVDRYDMNVNGSYEGVTAQRTEKTGKVGETVNVEINAATAEFTHDEAAAGKVESGKIPATGELVLKVYYSRNKYTVTFDVATSKSIKDNNATLSAVAPQDVYYGATATEPETNPTITGAPSMNFGGWFTEADGTTAYNFGTKITGNTTIFAQLTDKEITLSFDDDAFDSEAGIYRRYLIGGADAVGGNAADKGRKGDQLNFTLTVDGETLKTTEYNTYTTEQKAKLDSVKFNNEMIGGFQKISGTNEKGDNYRVADIAAGGMASARYAGVQKVTLNYLGTSSTNSANIVVPGDTDANGIINVADLSNMAQLLRETLTASNFGEAEPYIPYLTDMDGNGVFIVADISIAASMVRNVGEYSNSFKDSNFVND